MASDLNDFHQAFLAECEKHLFAISVPRLKKCLAYLSEEEVWFRPNAETVSVGNLILHLCGNMRQWIISSLGRESDTRERSQEFSEPGPLPTSALVAKLDELEAGARKVLARLDAEELLKSHKVQGRQETGIGILVHVVEHFSYHVGQITYFVKSGKGIDLQYYGNTDLNVRNSK